MIASRHKMEKGEDFSKKCQNCMKCKPINDDEGNIVMHACLIDGQPLGYLWPIHITTCNKFANRIKK